MTAEVQPRAKPTELPPALAERVGFLLGKTHTRIAAAAAESLGEPGFTMKHFGCLTVIATEGPLSQQRLSERIGLDRTTIVAIVDDLERAGYVERRRDPEDRRAYALEITRSGRTWRDQVGRALLEAEAEFLAPLTERERQTLVRLLQKLLLG